VLRKRRQLSQPNRMWSMTSRSRELIAGLKAQRPATIACGEEQTEAAPSLKHTIEVEPLSCLILRSLRSDPDGDHKWQDLALA